jgi:short-subunit dehydrogenase
MKLVNKTILVTGSTDGLGLKLVLELARQQANIIVHGRNEDKTKKVIKELQEIYPKGAHSYIVCDFNELTSIREAFGQVKKLDVLVNNAGVWVEGNTVDAEYDKIIEQIHVNLGAPILVTRTLLPILKQSEFGQILNVSSIAGVEIPFDYFHTYYSATKFGLQAFTEALVKEFDNKPLRVMGYYPGGMDTKIFTKAGLDYKEQEPWMFDPQESVEAIIFMLTRPEKLNLKRMDLINHLQK